MKVRFLMLSALHMGGAIRSLVNQANALAAAGHDVELVSIYRTRKRSVFPIDPRIKKRFLINRRKGPLHRPVHATLGKMPSRLVPPEEARYKAFSLATDLVIRRYLSRLSGGVMITGRPATTLMLARYAPPDVVRIGQDHLSFNRYKGSLLESMHKWYPQLDAVTVLTEGTAQDYRNSFGPALRVERVPNMLPTTQAERSPLDSKVIVAAGRLTWQKGFDLLVKAYAPLAREHPDWELRIFGGSGYMKDRLTSQITELGLDGKVRLMGKTKHLDQEMAGASMFVLSSRFEGFPMVVLEAMTHGLPVVAYDCHTGPADMLTHGEDGLLVPPRDVHALTKSIDELIVDADRRRRLGARAAESVTRYDSTRVGQQWTDLFTDLGALD